MNSSSFYYLISGFSLLALALIVLPKKKEKPKKSVYDLEPILLPRVSGFLLRALVFLCETSPFKNFLLSSMYRKNNFDKIKDFKIDNPITPCPVVPKLDNGLGFQYENYTAKEFIKDPSILDISQLPSSVTVNSTLYYHDAYKNKTTDPVAVGESFTICKNLSETHNPPLKAISQSNPDDIMNQAQESAERWRNGAPKSIIDGVPISIKDEMNLYGYTTTAGTKFVPEIYPPTQEDAFIVKKLREHGALLVGKNNMHEIGISTLGYNVHYGFTRNPYNMKCYPGGSSSGSASSVSAGLCPISIGADGGGSIRIPSSLCGVVGLKPTYGRVSHSGAFDLCYSVGHVGPIGATVLDNAIAYSIIAGPDKHDPHSLIQPEPMLPVFSKIPNNQPLAGLKLGIFTPWFNDCSNDVQTSCSKAVEVLKEQGATVVEVEISNLQMIKLAQVIIILSEMRNSMDRYLDEHKTKFQQESRITLSLLDVCTSADYLQANRIRTFAIDQLKDIFGQCDIIITPTAGITAPPINSSVLPNGESNLTLVSQLMNYAFLGNITGVPGLTIPVGINSDNLPIGLQLMGRWWEEDLLYYAEVLVAPHTYGVTGAPSIAQYGSSLFCVHKGVGTDNAMYFTQTNDLNTWSVDMPVPNAYVMGTPALTVFLSTLFVVYRGLFSEGDLWSTSYNGTHWSTPYNFYPNGFFTGSPTVTNLNGVLYMSTRDDEDNGIYWSFRRRSTFTTLYSPAMTAFNGLLYIFYCNPVDGSHVGDGIHYSVSTNGQDWSTSYTYIPNSKCVGDPVATVSGNKLVVAHRSPLNNLLNVATLNTLGVWSNDQTVSTSPIASDPGLASFNGKVVSTYKGPLASRLYYVKEQ
eukprot:gene4269-5342_t